MTAAFQFGLCNAVRKRMKPLRNMLRALGSLGEFAMDVIKKLLARPQPALADDSIPGAKLLGRLKHSDDISEQLLYCLQNEKDLSVKNFPNPTNYRKPKRGSPQIRITCVNKLVRARSSAVLLITRSQA